MPVGSGDRWPEDYERGRPGWPSESIHISSLPWTATVLDLGAGTGKLTRLLVSAFDRVLATEPAEPMRRLLMALCPETEVFSGTGQDIPLLDASIDAVFAAQSFHWFDEERAIAEIARVLRPRRHTRPDVEPPWRAVGAVDSEGGGVAEGADAEGRSRPYPARPRGAHASSGWRPAVADSPFEPFQATVMPNRQTLDRDELVAFFASMGWLADLPDNERLPLLDQVRSALTATECRRMWETHVHWGPNVWGKRTDKLANVPARVGQGSAMSADVAP
jgi:SAM-dependent methyltransferase